MISEICLTDNPRPSSSNYSPFPTGFWFKVLFGDQFSSLGGGGTEHFQNTSASLFILGGMKHLHRKSFSQWGTKHFVLFPKKGMKHFPKARGTVRNKLFVSVVRNISF